MIAENLENTEETPQDDNLQSETMADESTFEEGVETAQLKDDLAEANDKYIRLYAEFDNYRRRTTKEKVELIQTASERVLKDLLPIVDDFERAMKSMENATDIEAVKEGVSLIYHKLQKTLQAQGVKPMNSVGEEFNPDIQESIAQFPAGEENVGKVIEETTKGYLLHDKVLRYAQVVVGS